MAVRHFVVGGRGSQSVSDINGGGWQEGASAAWENFQDANGGPILVVSVSCDITDGTTGLKVTKAAGAAVGDWAAAKLGVFAYLAFDGVYASGHYRVIDANPTVNYMIVDEPWSANTTASEVRVGGAFTATKAGFDAAEAMVVASDYIDFGLGNDPGLSGTTGKITTSVGIVHTTSGGAGTEITVRGVDEKGLELTRGTEVLPIITTTTNSLAYLLTNVVTPVYIDYQSIDFDGGGAGKATNCIFSAAPFDTYFSFSECRFHNSNVDCVKWANHNGTWTNCDFYDSVTGDGFGSGGNDSTVVGCRAWGNAVDGLFFGNPNTNGNHNQAWENGQHGFSFGTGAATGSAVVYNYNSSYNNGDSGFRWGSHTGSAMEFKFNTASSNDVYNYNASAGDEDDWFPSQNFQSNHIYDGAWSWDDGDWENTLGGYNIEGDPLFVSIEPGEISLMLQYASPLVDGGWVVISVTGTWTTIGALDSGKNYPLPEDVRYGTEYSVGDSMLTGDLLVAPSVGTGFSRGIIT